MDFVQKSNFFLLTFFTEIISENIVFDIVESKEWYLEEKIEVFKRPKNAHYLEGLVHVLCKNLEFFLIGVFCRNHIRKDRFWYCGKKRMILSRKNWSFKKGRKIYIFQRGLVHEFRGKIELFLTAVFLQK